MKKFVSLLLTLALVLSLGIVSAASAEEAAGMASWETELPSQSIDLYIDSSVGKASILPFSNAEITSE